MTGADAVSPNEVHVVCPHDRWKFVASSIPGVWIIPAHGAEWVTYPDKGEWRHYRMRCGPCGIDVPVVKPDTYGPILDQLVQTDSPAITRVPPNVVEVPLKLVAGEFGRRG